MLKLVLLQIREICSHLYLVSIFPSEMLMLHYFLKCPLMLSKRHLPCATLLWLLHPTIQNLPSYHDLSSLFKKTKHFHKELVPLNIFEMCPIVVMHDCQLRSHNQSMSKCVQAGSLKLSWSHAFLYVLSRTTRLHLQNSMGDTKHRYTTLWLREAEKFFTFFF